MKHEKHMMPGTGHMMKDSDMKKKMGGKMPPKGMPKKGMANAGKGHKKGR